eukprot:g29693.t1
MPSVGLRHQRRVCVPGGFHIIEAVLADGCCCGGEFGFLVVSASSGRGEFGPSTRPSGIGSGGSGGIAKVDPMDSWRWQSRVWA